MDNQRQGGFRGNSFGGGQGGGFKTPYVPNAMDDRKLALTAPPVEGSKIPAMLQFTFPNGNPRGIVRTGIPDDKEFGKITSKMDMHDFFKLLEIVKKVIAEKGESRWALEIKAPAERPQNEDGSYAKKGPPVLQSTIMVGRTDKGRIYISILSPDGERPKIRFMFGQGYYSHIGRKGSNEPIPDAEVSDLAATAWVNMYEKLMPMALIHTYKPKEPREGGKGGDGGFKKQFPNKQGGGQKGDSQFFEDDFEGGGSKKIASPDDYEADIPF